MKFKRDLKWKPITIFLIGFALVLLAIGIGFWYVTGEIWPGIWKGLGFTMLVVWVAGEPILRLFFPITFGWLDD